MPSSYLGVVSFSIPHVFPRKHHHRFLLCLSSFLGSAILCAETSRRTPGRQGLSMRHMSRTRSAWSWPVAGAGVGASVALLSLGLRRLLGGFSARLPDSFRPTVEPNTELREWRLAASIYEMWDAVPTRTWHLASIVRGIRILRLATRGGIDISRNTSARWGAGCSAFNASMHPRAIRHGSRTHDYPEATVVVRYRGAERLQTVDGVWCLPCDWFPRNLDPRQELLAMLAG